MNETFKCLISGGPSQGKTSLLRASTGLAISPNQRPSVQEENKKVYLLDSGDITDQAGSSGRSSIVFHTWCLPGQQAAAPISTNIYMHNASFYRHAAVALITIDCQTLDEDAEVLEAGAANGFNPICVGSNLAGAARRNVEGIPIFLVLTKCDLLKGYSKGKSTLNPIDPRLKAENARIFANAEKFVADNDIQRHVLCTSAQDNVGVSSMYSSIYSVLKEQKSKKDAEAAAKEGGGAGGSAGAPAASAQKPQGPVRLVSAHQPEERQNRCVCKSG